MSYMWGAFSEKALKSLLTEGKRINIWEGAVRSGKTVTSLAAFLCFAAVAPPGALLFCGKTERTLKRNILDLLYEIAGPSDFTLSASNGEGRLFGRRFYIAGASDQRAEGKIRGLTLAGAYGDEITLWPRPFFQMLLSRLSVEGARFYGSTNPDHAAHWLLSDYLTRTEIDLARWHFTLDDNPNLPESYRDALRAEYTGLWYRRFVEGAWCASEGLVYDAFDPEKHVRTLDPPQSKCFAACDYGIQNPCVFGLIRTGGGEQPEECGGDAASTRRYHLAREYYHDGRTDGQKTDAEYAADLDTFAAGETNTVIIDPSASSLIVLLRKRGWRVIPARNAVLDGIRHLMGLLGEGALTIDPGCKHTIREFGGYVWDGKCGQDTPVKRDDHCMDMLRYGVYTHASSLAAKRPIYSGKGATL